MRQSRVVFLAVVICIAAIFVVACGGGGGDEGGSTASSGGNSGEYGVGLELGKEVLNSAPVGATVGPWYRWNSDSCTFEVTNDHPKKYKADLRPIEGGPNHLGYMHYGNTDPFGVENSKSIEAVASEVEMPLNVYNLKFPSRTEPLTDARLAVVKEDNGVIQANLDPTTLATFFNVLEGEGCIPSLQLYLPIEDHPAFGANWSDVGTAIGAFAAKEAAKRGWKEGETALVNCTDPASGPTVNIMFKTLPEAMAENGFEIPSENIFNLACRPDENQSGFRQVTDWYTSHPEFKYVVLAGVDTLRLPNMIRAAEQQDVPRDSYISGAGADEEVSQKLVREGKEDLSISFQGDRFGEYAVPLMEDIMAGNPVPKFVGMELVELTPENIEKYYPE